VRLSGLSLTAVLVFSSFMLAQHGSSAGGSSGSSSSSSSGGGSHSGFSGGSSYSGGSSGGSHSSGSGSSHSGSSGGHSAGSGHSSGGKSISNGSASRGKNEHGSHVTSRNRMEGSASKLVHPIHEPKSGVAQRAVLPEKRNFFSFLRHPFRKPPRKVGAKPALYLPRPICPKGRCAPPCPVGQVRSGGACTPSVAPVCVPGQIWNGISCGYDQCSHGAIWNGSNCFSHTRFLDNCLSLRMSVERQAKRVQAAEAARQSACANGPAPECSQATAAWQSEDNLRQNLLGRYQRCQMQSVSSYSSQYGRSPYESTLWFDSLRFNADF